MSRSCKAAALAASSSAVTILWVISAACKSWVIARSWSAVPSTHAFSRLRALLSFMHEHSAWAAGGSGVWRPCQLHPSPDRWIQQWMNLCLVSTNGKYRTRLGSYKPLMIPPTWMLMTVLIWQDLGCLNILTEPVAREPCRINTTNAHQATSHLERNIPMSLEVGTRDLLEAWFLRGIIASWLGYSGNQYGNHSLLNLLEWFANHSRHGIPIKQCFTSLPYL